MDTITIDGVDEHAFRHSIEDMLRTDEIDPALDRLRALIAGYAGTVLPARFLEVSVADIAVTGWDKLAARLASHDRPHFPITALGVVLADARVLGGPGPQGGRLAPFIKTYYFSDDAYPFTNAGRDDLLDGYSREGFGWQGDYQASDVTLGIQGVDDLHGALIALEDRLLGKASPSENELCAGTIGACYLAVLIHAALREAIRRGALPRPLCVLAACDGVYPFFDAPVAGWDECGIDVVPEAAWPSELDEVAVEGGAESAGEASLLDIRAHRGAKRMALAIGDDDAAAEARFTAEAAAQRLVMTDDNALRGLFHGVAATELVEVAWPDDAAAEPTAEADAPPCAELADEAFPAPGFTDLALLIEEPVRYEPFDPREQFRRAEAEQAFPTGTGLRQKLKSAEPVGPAPLAARAQALSHTCALALRRGGVVLRRRLAGGLVRAWASMRRIVARRPG